MDRLILIQLCQAWSDRGGGVNPLQGDGEVMLLRKILQNMINIYGA